MHFLDKTSGDLVADRNCHTAGRAVLRMVVESHAAADNHHNPHLVGMDQLENNFHQRPGAR